MPVKSASAVPLTRRRFLVGGSTLLAAAALSSGRELLPGNVVGGLLTDRRGPLARLASSSSLDDGISVGYLEGLDPDADPLAEGQRVVPAGAVRGAGLGAGSGRGPVSTVRVRVGGAAPGLAADDTFGDVSLDALFESPDPAAAEPLTYYAWTRRAGSAVGNAATFVAAVDGTPRLGFTLASGGAAGAPGRTVRTVFTEDRGDGRPTLRHGHYLLGLRPGTWDRPRTLPAADDIGAWGPLASLLVTVRPA